MKTFSGSVLFLDRPDINTDEIIPAKYLTEIRREALKPYLFEDLNLEGFDSRRDIPGRQVVISRANFGCGSSREHAPWALEANGIRLVIDGTAAPEIEQILNAELESMDQRHSQGKGILDVTAKYAPAYGMIGTLMGLVAMLNNMDDPKKIGPGMAVAILTTFYGAMIANVLCLPMADKLSYRHEEEMLLRTIMLKGILSLQAGDNPRVTQAKLSVYLPVDVRSKIEGPATRTAKQ